MRKRYYNFGDCDRLQVHLDAVHGAGEYRIVVLDAARQFRVRHRTCRQPARRDICLVLWNRHYSFIGHPREIFSVYDNKLNKYY